MEKLNSPDFFAVEKMSGEERKEVLKQLDLIEVEVKKCKEDGARFNRYQDVLKMEPTPFEDVDDLKLSFTGKAKLWRGMDNWDNLSNGWKDTAFGGVDTEVMTKKV